ncbi:MAG TPA: signal recognition particle-docking protein FtsY [Candidatus Babeliales bacterium]|nr:signal recognition particle-docking protein FtsY [Candidatus Babeliales bacterium]
MFSFIKDTLKKVYTQFTSQVSALFARETIDQATLKELETLLISADTGVKTTKHIIENLKQQVAHGSIKVGPDLHKALEQQLIQLLPNKSDINAQVYLLVGINGSGKTTFAGKLAYRLHNQGKKVLLIAGDTFRAAAVDQLKVWAERTDSTIIAGTPNQEPASVVFTGCEEFKKGNFDNLIIDTAGRLQTKSHLMRELEKIKKIIERQLPNIKICTLLTVDSMLGQNSLEQARLFNESTKLDGIVLTKMDGTGKGGIVFSISQELGLPIAFISFGENLENLKEFNPQEYVSGLLS